jgi:porin
MRWETLSFAARLTAWLFTGLIGGWLLMRGVAAAEDSPFGITAVSVTDILANVDGGVRTGLRTPEKADLAVTYTGEDDWAGWSAFLDLQATAAVDANGLTGSLQGISNIDAPAGGRVLDAWISRDFDGVGGWKAGLVDLNSEFDTQPTAVLFLNPSHGIGPDFSQSGENGPSIFPSVGLGLVGWWLPGDHWTLKAGVFEGTAGNPGHPGRTDLSLTSNEGVLMVFEARNHLTPNVIVGGGAWLYSAASDTIGAPHAVHGNGGIYALADGQLYAAPGSANGGLSGWIRLGFANAAVNPVAFYAGGGLVYTAPWEREADQVGLSIAYARIGGPARRAALAAGGIPADAETTFEATYSYAFSEHVILQPDVQYIIAPGADRALRNSLVIGSRVTVTFDL